MLQYWGHILVCLPGLYPLGSGFRIEFPSLLKLAEAPCMIPGSGLPQKLREACATSLLGGSWYIYKMRKY